MKTKLKPTEKQLADERNRALALWAVMRTVLVHQVATWMIGQIGRDLDLLRRDLAAKLAHSDLGPGASRAYVAEVLADIDGRIAEVFAEMRDRLVGDLDELSEVEDERDRRALLLLFGEEPKKKLPLAKAAVLLVMGATIAKWMSVQAGDLSFRVVQAVRGGVAAGDDALDIAATVKGRAAKGARTATPPITDQTLRSLEPVVRTAVQASSQDTLDHVASALPKRVDMGWQQISVLDRRTTDTCRAYAFKLWTRDFKPVGHALPYAGGVPRHWNCRSRIVPVDLAGEASDKLTFKGWMVSLGEKVQDEIFGARNTGLWRSGKLDDQNLLHIQKRELSIDQLRRIPDRGLPTD